MVQANLESPQSASRFTADMKTVLAQRPDFITYNEVAYRSDAQLAPPGYDMYRKPGKYTGETPVAWDSTKWHATATGTYWISNSTAKTAAQRVMLGVRYANWATLTNDAGRVISLVSVHTAPNGYPVQQLIGPSMVRVGTLVKWLGKSGPVLTGGDFNMHYKGSRYQGGTLAKYSMTPTFDVLRKAVSTHDAGGIIDYIFLRSASKFAVQDQYVVNLNSDHKLLGADLTPLWTTSGSGSAPPTGGTGSGSGSSAGVQPSTVDNSARPAPGTVARRIITILDRTPSGAAVHLASLRLSGSAVVKALLRADRRGVNVQVLSGNSRPTSEERQLWRALGSDVRTKRWASIRPSSYARSGLPKLSLLVSKSTGTSAVRVVSDRPLTSYYQQHQFSARITTSLSAYNTDFSRFFAGAGRPL